MSFLFQIIPLKPSRPSGFVCISPVRWKHFFLLKLITIAENSPGGQENTFAILNRLEHSNFHPLVVNFWWHHVEEVQSSEHFDRKLDYWYSAWNHWQDFPFWGGSALQRQFHVLVLKLSQFCPLYIFYIFTNCSTSTLVLIMPHSWEKKMYIL